MFRIPVTPGALASNELLARLPDAAAERLRPFLHEVNLRQQQTVYDIGEQVGHVYFPAGAVVSGVLLMNDGTMIETCLVGSEGVVGVNAAFGEHKASNWMRALLPGRAFRMRADLLREAVRDDRDLQALVLCYYRTRINQVSHRAVCNSRHRVNERLATWLLMLDGRAPGAELPLTQEVIARQVGVRRAGVNESMGVMERAGMIEQGRGRVRVRDREMLEHAACACHRTFTAESEWYKDFKPGRTAAHSPRRPEPVRLPARGHVRRDFD